MSRFAGRRYLLWLVLFHVLGCDTVGAALVDEGESGGFRPALPCTAPPICDEELGPAASVAPRPLPPIDFGKCRLAREGECVRADADAALPDAGPGGDATVSNAGPQLPGCIPKTTLDAGSPDEGVPCGPEPTLECDEIVIESSAVPDSARHHVARPVWSGAEVLIRSAQRFEVELQGAWLFDVSITLDGPITLRIVDSDLARRLRVRTTSAAAGQSRLELNHVVGEQILVGEPGASLGRVDVVRSELTDVQLIATQLRLESATLLGGLVEAGDLAGTDADLSDLEMSFDSMLLSVFQLRRSQVTHCIDLTLIEGTVVDSQFPPCTEGHVRFYSAFVLGGTFDGIVESDRSNWSGVAMGARAPTEVTAWDSALTSVALCSKTRSLILAATSQLKCSSCPDGTPEPSGDASTKEDDLDPCVPPLDLTGAGPEQLCFIPSPSDRPDDEPAGGNFCELPAELPICHKPHPERARPLEQPF